jgi:hypothetical protein
MMNNHAWAGGSVCSAIALRNVPAIENDDSIVEKGNLLTSITQYRVNKKTGKVVFCSYGGYCYPKYIDINGNLLLALKLTNCRVADNPVPNSFLDDDEIFYSLDEIRSKIPPDTLRRSDLFQRLEALGVCPPCAGNSIQYYIEKPNSKCAKIVLRALEGNPDAVSILQSQPSYCQWPH